MEGPSAADDFGGSRWPSHRARVPCCAKSLGKGEEGSVLMITSARKSATFHEVLLCFLSDSVQGCGRFAGENKAFRYLQV